MKQLRGQVVFFLLLCIAVTSWGCCQRTMAVGSPFDRYDHNRTRPLAFSSTNGFALNVINDEVYAPMGSKYFPSATYSGGQPTPDKLPVANVVPVFTGISLPLSKELVEHGESDWKDLLDYLASGPLVQAGVERPSMAGDREASEASYGPILDLLASREMLSQDKQKIRLQLTGSEDTCPTRVADGRYDNSSFREVATIEFGDFLFILYKLPDFDYFSRLVVIPLVKRGQNFPQKRP